MKTKASSKGFSLVAVMIAVGISAIVIAGIARFMGQQFQAQNP